MGYRDAQKVEYELLTYHARLVAGLNRWPKDKYLPSLDELIADKAERKAQSPGEMLEAFQEMQDRGAPIMIRQVKRDDSDG